jgi:hypothetical protein
MLDKTPDERPGSAREVAAELEPFVSAADGASASASAIAVEAARGASASTSAIAVEAARGAAASTSAIAVEAARGAEAGSAPVAARIDTVALLERAGRAAEVPARLGVAIVLALSLLAGAVTYVVRTQVGASPPPVSGEPAGVDAGAER